MAQHPPAYQEKLSRYRRWQDAQSSLLGRLLLQKGLSLFCNYELNFRDLEYGDNGKPFLPDSLLYFNISHSHELVVCVIRKGGVVGVDIEYIRPIPTVDFKFQMTDNEWQIINNAQDRVGAFYDYWSSKEAVLKVDGRGMQLGLKTFEVAADRKTALVANKTWHLQKCEPDVNYCCYIASSDKVVDAPISCQFSF